MLNATLSAKIQEKSRGILLCVDNVLIGDSKDYFICLAVKHAGEVGTRNAQQMLKCKHDKI